MAPHLRSVSPPHRGVAWAIAVIALSLCASSWSASEPDTTRKARKRAKARPAHSEVAQLAPAPARVTPLHVCPNAQGRTEYRQHPCPDGGRQLLGHDDTRAASQLRHSAAMAQREKALFTTMTRDRERQARLDVLARTPKPSQQAQRPRQKKKVVDEASSDRARRGKREPAWPRYRSLTPLTADTPQERVKF
ncbi:hypothetical protein [Aquabacterium sp.]|uniref:hypothetical protein n=1 Tax=Aquabacterium sp. TaxID=1872578 RepID=UPI00261A6044|nr:hypothetical protein [Aquabacterium sp.]MDD2978317.1 hypothetical protein [Aquabacterium sp.]